jgi:hypothetical protein
MPEDDFIKPERIPRHECIMEFEGQDDEYVYFKCIVPECGNIESRRREELKDVEF